MRKGTKKRPAKYAGQRVENSPFKNFQDDRRAERCGGRKRNGEPCRMKAGAGTDHEGFGRCRFHGGNLPSHNSHLARQQAIEFMGAPIDITPLQAIIWCIRITAGEVQFLSEELAKVTNSEFWFEDTVSGKQMHVLQRARAEAQDRLVSYSKIAIGLGLAERSIRLAEQFGATIARLLEGIRGEIALTPAQSKQWPIIVRRHLILLEGGRPGEPPVEGATKELVAGD